jgi:hypothetical protein
VRVGDVVPGVGEGRRDSATGGDVVFEVGDGDLVVFVGGDRRVNGGVGRSV